MRIAIVLLIAACGGIQVQADTPAPGKTKAISGQFTAAFEGFNQFGLPQVRLKLRLTSSLECPPSAPKLTFSVKGGADAYFVSAPTEKAGYLSAGFVADVRDSGAAESVTTSLPAGANVLARASSVTCQCGHRDGEGGFIDLATEPLAIPPWLKLLLPAQAKQLNFLVVTASPRGAETVEVRLDGAGLKEKKVFSEADFGGKASVSWQITPTEKGDLTATATLLPVGAAQVLTAKVDAP